jgi:hypothetical protein
VIGRRWWQHRDGGISPNPGWGDAAGWTEVQVVPLDAIVIERAEQPSMSPEQAESILANVTAGIAGAFPRDAQIAALKLNALHRLVAAEYLREHPPVDEAQVQELSAVLREATVRGDFDHYARQLIRAGWSK